MSSFGWIIAWYTTLSKLHKPFIGQSLRDLQLHSIFLLLIFHYYDYLLFEKYF